MEECVFMYVSSNEAQRDAEEENVCVGKEKISSGEPRCKDREDKTNIEVAVA